MTATVVDEPDVRGLGPVRDPVTAVVGAVCLPFVYATWWFGDVTRQLRELGCDCRDQRLSAVSPAWAWVGMAVGWILVVPAVVVMVGTARRVQHAEELSTVGRQSIAGVIAAVVAGQALGLAAVLAGYAVVVPFALLASAVFVVATLQPRLNRAWESSAAWLARDDPETEAIPLVPPTWTRRWQGLDEDVQEFLGFWLVAVAAVVAAAGVFFLATFLAAEDRTGPAAGFGSALSLIALLAGVSLLIGSLLRRIAVGRRFTLDSAVAGPALLSAVVAAAWLWVIRPLFHGMLMPLYQWPLATWIPLAAGLVFTALVAAVGNPRAAIMWRVPVTLVVWGVFMLLLPGWQARALYEATEYVPTDLPRTTQPRLLPKVAALAFASDASLHDAHLVVDPSSHRLVWSAEQAGGWPREGPSRRVVALRLDSVNGAMHEVGGRFDPAVSRVGPGSLQWRAYDRHFLTRVQDAVLVPGDAETVAVAPYLRYTGFPVRHPVWAGVYVYHQDGRMEDLTPAQALARPELAHSGRLYPERLARAVADSDPRTEIDDPPGNPQPYLTNLGDNEERWVSVGHPAGDADTVSAVYLTDGETGRTSVWRPPRGARLLSNEGAVAVTQRLPIQWDRMSDFNDDITWLRKVAEPTPVFARGRLYYLVSIVPNRAALGVDVPVETTVVVDAARRRVVKEFDDAGIDTSSALLAFFNP